MLWVACWLLLNVVFGCRLSFVIDVGCCLLVFCGCVLCVYSWLSFIICCLLVVVCGLWIVLLYVVCCLLFVGYFCCVAFGVRCLFCVCLMLVVCSLWFVVVCGWLVVVC